MKMKLDLSKFKMKHRDDDHATLLHPEGHEIKIAIKRLHPENRKNLESLEMHIPASSAKMHQGAEMNSGAASQSMPMAEGGPANPKLAESKKSPRMMAKGGKVDYEAIKLPKSQEPLDYEEIKEDDKPEHPLDIESIDEPQKMATGGEASDDDSQDSAPASPVTVNVGQPQGEALPIATSPQALNSSMQPTPDAPQAAQPAASSQQLPQVPPKGAPTPDTMHGYQQQIAGAQQQAQAESAIGKTQETVLKGQALGQQKVMDDYQQHFNALNAERQALTHDILNKHIDPNHYLGSMSTGQRIGTALSLLAGGIGAGLTGGPNQALQMLNSQIDRDIEAQKAAIGQKETLLSANMRQYGNLKDATDMTKIMMHDIASTQLQQAVASQASPAAQARAKQITGALEMQTAPMMQQLSMRRMLQSGQGAAQQDPASYVPFVVPADRQKDVLHEIGQAQNAIQNSDAMMKHFDEATKENTVGGRASRLGFTPPSILAMRASMLPIIHDAEGRVNEFEQKTTSDLEPKPGDKESTIAAKRQALQQFLQQKAAAPNAKAFGIDLSKFASTSHNPEARLSPQQQSFAEWARSNPNDPRSAAVLKKLGIQ